MITEVRKMMSMVMDDHTDNRTKINSYLRTSRQIATLQDCQRKTSLSENKDAGKADCWKILEDRVGFYPVVRYHCNSKSLSETNQIICGKSHVFAKSLLDTEIP